MNTSSCPNLTGIASTPSLSNDFAAAPMPLLCVDHQPVLLLKPKVLMGPETL
ncbi:hypothetical protein PtA15_18A204 [Puccinia triticina]|uniref:Uncharacterized protein n=1 Tax=Puccinia triticina TaxID=208348 RepID=A0ABY7D9W7_9BASI|nr:uncharacterized protein PtA15_18A204 [Puccinia triticina]WAQ93146.1 hypothetical protein PtA15_18A204 [Puccinia triticina]